MHQTPHSTVPTAAAGFRVRDLTGADQLLVQNTGTETAIALLERVCGCDHDRIARLTPGERDALLAALYQKTYGPRIQGTVQCLSCHKPFDVHCVLDELFEAVRQSANDGGIEFLPDRTFRTQHGVRFRLPTGEDELAVRGMPTDEAEAEMMKRCIIDAPAIPYLDALQEAMEQVCPIVDLNLDARCPECGVLQEIRFDLQSYLLQALAQERKQLWHDTHALAIAYHWSLTEIVGLSRADRRALVSILAMEGSRRTGV
jgi:hypothetical protein